MGGYYGLAILLGLALCLIIGQCSDSCGWQNGEPGMKGSPGRDGLRGAKGEKGEPAVTSDGPVDADVLQKLKGEAGIRGPQGDMGPKGYSGDLGAMGQPGQPGRPGPDGNHGGEYSTRQAHSAFSAIRTENSYPQYDKPVIFQEAVVNKPAHFNTATGFFTCRTPGVYYFTFQSMATVSMCLRIASDALDANKRPGFCDYHENSSKQVLSGGVVLQLTAGQRVWLHTFREDQKDGDRSDRGEKQIIFNGFLLFSNAE